MWHYISQDIILYIAVGLYAIHARPTVPSWEATLTWYEGSVYWCMRSKCFMVVNMMLTT